MRFLLAATILIISSSSTLAGENLKSYKCKLDKIPLFPVSLTHDAQTNMYVKSMQNFEDADTAMHYNVVNDSIILSNTAVTIDENKAPIVRAIYVTASTGHYFETITEVLTGETDIFTGICVEY